MNNHIFEKSVHYGNTDVKHVNSENIPIIKLKYYFGFWDIEYLLLCYAITTIDINKIFFFKKSKDI